MTGIYEHFLRWGVVCENGEPRRASMGTASNAFIVAYKTGKIHLAAPKGSAAYAAACAGRKLWRDER